MEILELISMSIKIFLILCAAIGLLFLIRKILGCCEDGCGCFIFLIIIIVYLIDFFDNTFPVFTEKFLIGCAIALIVYGIRIIYAFTTGIKENIREKRRKKEEDRRQKLEQIRQEKIRINSIESFFKEIVYPIIPSTEFNGSNLDAGININYNNEYYFSTIDINNNFEVNVVDITIPIKWMTNKEQYDYYKNNIDFLNNLYKFNDFSQLYIEKIEHFKKLTNDTKSTELLETLKIINANFSAIANIYQNRYNALRLGIDGEDAVNNSLQLYKNIINLEGINIEFEGISVECDNILVCTKGIFILEVKNYASKGQYNLMIDSSGRWVKNNGYNEEVLSNPNEQNNRHIAVINNLINTSLKRNLDNFIDSIGIVVIANNTVNIYNDSKSQIVVRASEIYNTIQMYPNKLTEKEIMQIVDVLEKNRSEDKKFKILDLYVANEYLEKANTYFEDSYKKADEIILNINSSK